MTYTEFVNRTNVKVTGLEFEVINNFYMSCELNKDEFCKMWCKMNPGRVKAAKVEKIIAEREQQNRDFAYRLVNNGYTFDQMETYAIDFFNNTEYIFLVSRLRIEMVGHRADGRAYSKTLRDVIYDLNKYLYPNA